MLRQWRSTHPGVVELTTELGAADAVWFPDQGVMVWGEDVPRRQREAVLVDLFPELTRPVPHPRVG